MKKGSKLNRKTERHGMSKTPEYNIWQMLKDRCLNKNGNNVKEYIEKGITVCDEWKNSFLAFYRDMGPRPSKDHSIDRIDNEKGYFKENCRWATKTEQSRNQGLRKDNKSGARGVCWDKNTKKWNVRISLNKQEKSLGQFKDLKDAIEERKKAELKYWN